MNNHWNQFANLFPNAAPLSLDENGKIRIRKNKTRRNNNHTKPLKGNSNKRPTNRVVGFANTVQVRRIDKIGQHKTPSGLPTSTGLPINDSTDNVLIFDMLAKRLRPRLNAPESEWDKLPYTVLMHLDYLPVSDSKKEELYAVLVEAYPDLTKYWAWKKN